jgi:hypothetical protein
MNQTISHSWAEESPEAKARWFQSLTVEERMDMLCWFTDFVLAANPRIVSKRFDRLETRCRASQRSGRHSAT